MEEAGTVTGHSEVLIPPFAGWQAATVNEVHTDCLGGRHCDRAVQLSDETLILEQAREEQDRLQVMSSAGEPGQTRWVFRGPRHAIGVTELPASDGRTYTRHRNADEIQYQVAGTRLLVSANGTAELTPGTFIHIPVGVAYASITAGTSKHLTTVTTGKLACMWQAAAESSQWSLEDIEAYREHAAAAPAAMTR
jgi:hypothetical protein